MSLSPTYGVVHIMVSPSHIISTTLELVCVCVHVCTHTHIQETIRQQCLWSLLVNILYF